MNVDFCTIASANYLPKVRVLQQSLAKYAPKASLHVLLCEHPDTVAKISAETGYTFIAPDTVCADWKRLAFQYEITEFNTALKPFLLEYLLARHCEGAIYLDPDIEVFSSTDQIIALLTSHDLILTPHVCLPMDMDGHKPGIDETLRAGLYNLGFIGISNRPEALAALRWWRDICRDYCLFDPSHRYFVDQFWAAALPAFIQNFHCLRDPGCNVAYWNIFQRTLTGSGEAWSVDGRPLVFYHFSGLPEDIQVVSRHQDRVTAPPGSALGRLLSGYRDKVAANSWAHFGATSYSFSSYSDGSRILPTERRTLLTLTEPERIALGNPFGNPVALRARAEQLFRRSQLSLSRKYFRALATHGFLRGHREILIHFYTLVRDWLKRSGKLA